MLKNGDAKVQDGKLRRMKSSEKLKKFTKEKKDLELDMYGEKW